jgi:hypothetical protein
LLTWLKKSCELGLPRLQKMSHTVSEINVESQANWLWTLGNFKTWIKVGLHGQALRPCPDKKNQSKFPTFQGRITK